GIDLSGKCNGIERVVELDRAATGGLVHGRSRKRHAGEEQAGNNPHGLDGVTHGCRHGCHLSSLDGMRWSCPHSKVWSAELMIADVVLRAGKVEQGKS